MLPENNSPQWSLSVEYHPPTSMDSQVTWESHIMRAFQKWLDSLRSSPKELRSPSLSISPSRFHFVQKFNWLVQKFCIKKCISTSWISRKKVWQWCTLGQWKRWSNSHIFTSQMWCWVKSLLLTYTSAFHLLEFFYESIANKFSKSMTTCNNIPGSPTTTWIHT